MIENGRADSEAYAEIDIIETTDEDGKVHIFEKISEIEVEGQDYALLVYKGNEEEIEAGAQPEAGYEEEVVVMKISYEDGQEVYEAIEDKEEFDRVVAFIDNMEDDESGIFFDVSEVLEGDDEEEDKA